MTTEKKTRKPRRKLSDIDFSGEGAHLALVSKNVNGGPANGADYALVIKAREFSEEFVQKMQQVRITMELPDFLEKFFYLWEGDAKVLAYMMGYVEPAETQEEEKMEADEEFQNWVKERMEGFEILKSMRESSIAQVLSEISEEDYLAVLKDQELLEKAFDKADKESKSAKTEDNTSQIGTEVEKEDEVETSVVKQANKENSMSKKDENQSPEMVEKAAVDAIQKAFDEQKEKLEKALETLAAYEAEKKEMIVKAKTAQLQEAVDAKHLDVIAKAALALESDEDFNAFVSVMKEIKASVEKSALFEEQGASGETQEAIKESGVAKVLKAQFNKTK